MTKKNYAIMVLPDNLYPVSYTIKQDGTKVYELTHLLGKDLTEGQIKQLEHFDSIPPKHANVKVKDSGEVGCIEYYRMLRPDCLYNVLFPVHNQYQDGLRQRQYWGWELEALENTH